MGEQVDIEIEIISKPRHDYQTSDWAESGLPKAPAIMLDDDIIVAGRDIDEEELQNVIRRHLGRI